MKLTSLLIIILFFSSCATVTQDTKQNILDNGYAGHWVTYKFQWNGNNKHEVNRFLTISCDGEIQYSIDQPEALFFKKDTDDGKIISIQNDQISLKSWTGLEYSYHITKPIKEENGCMKITFKGYQFKTFYPTDCTKPQKSLHDALSEFYSFVKNNNYVYCD